MKKSIVVHVAKFLVVTLFWSVPVSRAQDKSDKSESKQPTEAQETSIRAYRLDFAINELEDGRKINSRQYSLDLNANDANAIEIGTRVPVEAKQGEMQYIDLGTNIWSRVKERDNGLALEVRAAVTSFASPDQAGRNSMPLLRQMKINGSTLIAPGRPTVVGSVDDPNSKRQFQLEVTATKLK